MTDIGWILGAGALVFIALAMALLWRPVASAVRDARLRRARREFHQQREWLEVTFFERASNSGKPRGLIWTECDFADEVVYARDLKTGEIAAFVAVTIGFEAVKGGLMEGVEAVGNLRAATAVFRYRRGSWYTGHWFTEGRALFNLSPTEAIAYYQSQMEPVANEAGHRA